MTPGSIAGTDVTLDVLRRAYGRSMRPLTSAGAYEEGAGWWIGITGAPDPDYNLALVYDGDVSAHAQRAFEVVTAAGRPSIVLLAGRGLAAAQVLADRGWVCAGALDLTALVPADAPEDDSLRVLGRAEMPDARDLAAGAFGVLPGTAAIAYADTIADEPGLAVVGIFDDAQLQCCTLVSDGGEIETVWSLGTRRGRQRRGYARRLVDAAAARTYSRRGAVPMCGLTNPRVTPLYLSAGAQVLENWQMWSRPRWLLGL